MAKKTYNQKLHASGDLPKVVDISENAKYVQRYNGTKMLIAAPIQYDEIMSKVPKGKVLTADKMRDFLARKAGADVTCPLTAGIFMNVCAYAAIERVDFEFPWWRTLKTGGELNDRFPGGAEAQKSHLESEGFQIYTKGKKLYVRDYEAFIWEVTL